MPTPEDLLTQAATEAVAATQIAKDWVNRPVGWFSDTESGPLPSIKQFLAEKAELIDAGIATVQSIEALRLLPARFNGQQVFLSGYYAGSTKGAGPLTAIITASPVDDGGVNIAGPNCQWTRQLDGFVTPEMFGAMGNGIFIDRVPLQLSINYGAANNIKTKMISPVYLINRSGSTVGGRQYGILIPDNANIEGLGYLHTRIKAAPNSDMDLMTTPRGFLIKNIRLSEFSVDGDSANQTLVAPNQTAGGLNMWLSNIENIAMDNLKSIDSGNFGFRLQGVSNLTAGTIVTQHRADINADGFHIKDSHDLVIDKLLIYSEGDDGLIINAELGDIHDIAIGEVVISTPVFVAGGRGVLISNAVANVNAGIQREIYNINISSLVTHNCDASSLSLQYANFRNIHINHVDYGSVKGTQLVVGGSEGSGVSGVFDNVRIKSSCYNTQENALQTDWISGDIKNCNIDISAVNPGSGLPAVTFAGNHSTFRFNVEYDNNAANPTFGVRSSTGAAPLKCCNVYASVRNAVNGIQLNATAVDNNLHIFGFENNTTDIDLNGAVRTNVSGGKITTLKNNGVDTRFSETRGCTANGRLTLTPGPDGRVLIPHGLISTPRHFKVQYFGGDQIVAYPDFRDATNIRVQLRNFAGAPVTSGSHQINWSAEL